MWDLPYVKLKFWFLVWPRIKPGLDRKVHHKEFWWLEIHRAYRICRGKKVKINFVGLCGTDSRKNRPILQESSGQTSLKAIG